VVSAIPPVDQAISQQSVRFGPAVQCAAVAVSPAWSPLMATSIVAVAPSGRGEQAGLAFVPASSVGREPQRA
jgi:hypothetical protein